MIEILAKHPGDVAMSVFAAVVAMSCFLYINSKPRGMKEIGDKLLAYVVGFGAFGLMVSPFFEEWNYPNWFELFFIAGTAIYAFVSTRALWCVSIFERAAAIMHEEERECSH